MRGLGEAVGGCGSVGNEEEMLEIPPEEKGKLGFCVRFVLASPDTYV